MFVNLTDDIGALLDTENCYVEALIEKYRKYGLVLTDNCINKIRIGIRHELLAELELSKIKNERGCQINTQEKDEVNI